MNKLSVPPPLERGKKNFLNSLLEEWGSSDKISGYGGEKKEERRFFPFILEGGMKFL